MPRVQAGVLVGEQDALAPVVPEDAIVLAACRAQYLEDLPEPGRFAGALSAERNDLARSEDLLVLRHGGDQAFLPLGVGSRLAHDDDRAACVLNGLLPDRAEQEPGEAAVPTGADDEQVGVSRRVEEDLYDGPFDGE